MNKKYFPLILLVSVAACVAKDKSANTLPEEAPQQQPEGQDQIGHRPPMGFNELFHELDRSIRSSMISTWSQIDKRMKDLSEQIETSMKGDKKNLITPTSVNDANEKTTIEVALPKDLKFEPADVDVINNRVFSTEIKDNKLTLHITGSIDRGRLHFEDRLEYKDQDEDPKNMKRVLHRRALSQTILGKPQLENLSVEYNKDKHSLNFVIPKEFIVQEKQSVKIKMK